ncbi:hypothetical protein K438DRAFT_1774741 [Mycena galopus ATCC 62051]|nr:hypothetical protein K438DRAFT_1774741 [Mycena galopus ATCC 62051]
MAGGRCQASVSTLSPREEHCAVRDELVECGDGGDVGVVHVPADDVERVVRHFLADLEHLGVVYHVTMKAVSMLIHIIAKCDRASRKLLTHQMDSDHSAGAAHQRWSALFSFPRNT